MNRSDYKRLGDYIEPVDERNTNGEIKLSQGISNNKYFQTPKQVATDSTKDNIVRRGYFAYNRATTRNGEKISIAYREGEDCTVSGAYQVFRIKDESLLHPVYLWMWFRRPEFDRYARFKSHGSAHEFFEFDEMCEVMLPVPSIERQRAMVAEYETLSRRIDLNRSMIAQLEATAQTLYRKTFVDDIDPEHLPAGWRVGALTDIATYMNGTACQKYTAKGKNVLPVLKIRELSQGFCDQNSDFVDTSIPKDFIVDNGDVIFSWSASLFIDIWCGNKCALNQHLFKVTSDAYPKWFYFLWTHSHIKEWTRIISAKATSMGHIKREDLENAQVIIPTENALKSLDVYMHPIFNLYVHKKKENLLLTDLQSLLLTKMGQ